MATKEFNLPSKEVFLLWKQSLDDHKESKYYDISTNIKYLNHGYTNNVLDENDLLKGTAEMIDVIREYKYFEFKELFIFISKHEFLSKKYFGKLSIKWQTKIFSEQDPFVAMNELTDYLVLYKPSNTDKLLKEIEEKIKKALVPQAYIHLVLNCEPLEISAEEMKPNSLIRISDFAQKFKKLGLIELSEIYNEYLEKLQFADLMKIDSGLNLSIAISINQNKLISDNIKLNLAEMARLEANDLKLDLNFYENIIEKEQLISKKNELLFLNILMLTSCQYSDDNLQKIIFALSELNENSTFHTANVEFIKYCFNNQKMDVFKKFLDQYITHHKMSQEQTIKFIDNINFYWFNHLAIPFSLAGKYFFDDAVMKKYLDSNSSDNKIIELAKICVIFPNKTGLLSTVRKKIDYYIIMHKAKGEKIDVGYKRALEALLILKEAMLV